MGATFCCDKGQITLLWNISYPAKVQENSMACDAPCSVFFLGVCVSPGQFVWGDRIGLYFCSIVQVQIINGENLLHFCSNGMDGFWSWYLIQDWDV